MRKTVMVVDDDPKIRSVLLRMLSPLAVDLMEAVHTDDALRLITRQQFDVVIADWLMPGGGGKRLVEALAHQSPDTRIILVTGAQFQRSDANWSGWDAISAVLEKPLSVESLRAEVERVLGE